MGGARRVLGHGGSAAVTGILHVPGAGIGAGKPALFLDRDGTLIPHRFDHVLLAEHVAPLPGVVEALAGLREADVGIAITSNQSAVGRGLLDEQDALALHGLVLDAVVGAGGRIDASFLCPHTPDGGCACRKPLLGLFHAAIATLQPDLTRSAVVGDSVADVVAALDLGVTAALVLTGRGEESVDELSERGLLERCRVYPSLVEVVDDVVWHGVVPRPHN